jgi:hypothetical protein
VKIAALIISIVSAVTAGVSVYVTWQWRRESQLSAAKLVRTLILRKQVYVDTELTRWSASGIHNSVYELRDELATALMGLPTSQFEVGQEMVAACTSYLVELRHFTHPVQEPLDNGVLAAHAQWRAALDTQISHLSLDKRQHHWRLWSRKTSRPPASS